MKQLRAREYHPTAQPEDRPPETQVTPDRKAADDDVVPANLTAAEIRAEIIAQFQAAFPEYPC